jgi:hypothetical protein
LFFPVAILFLIYPNHDAAQHKKQEPSVDVGTLLKAAEQGDIQSQMDLAAFYIFGVGVEKNSLEALKWYRRAADQGNANAQFMVGLMYDQGTDIPQDYIEAAKCYCKAAEQGNAPAQSNLGWMYADGKGVTQDYVQAHMWFNLSAAGSKGKEYEEAAKYRDVVAEKMTPQQIAEAQRLATEWKPKQAK